MIYVFLMGVVVGFRNEMFYKMYGIQIFIKSAYSLHGYCYSISLKDSSCKLKRAKTCWEAKTDSSFAYLYTSLENGYGHRQYRTTTRIPQPQGSHCNHGRPRVHWHLRLYRQAKEYHSCPYHRIPRR